MEGRVAPMKIVQYGIRNPIIVNLAGVPVNDRCEWECGCPRVDAFELVSEVERDDDDLRKRCSVAADGKR